MLTVKTDRKKDIIYISLILISFLGLVLWLSISKYYGSKTDWYSQHVSFAEYFRSLFYDTHDLLPDFAFNIGSGQNIYNFSYYGLLSPVILISYLFPDVMMADYLIAATVLSVLVSAILLYIFLKTKGFSCETCFLSVLMFVFASPISFHSHRHIMFMIYMPFLIMGLFGVEKKVNKGKGWLLSLSLFLIIMTSYYYSVGAALSLFVYGIFIWIKENEKSSFGKFIRFVIGFSVPFIVAVLASSIITLPTLAAIMNNRADSHVSITFLDLFLPDIKFDNLLYDGYGLGLNAIAIPAIVNLFKRKKEKLFLGCFLSLFAVFDVFNYFLNGTMYVDSKSLIPFLPLYIIAIAMFIEDTFKGKIQYKIVVAVTIAVTCLVLISKYKTIVIIIDVSVLMITLIVYRIKNKKLFFVLPVFAFTIASGINTNRVDELMVKHSTEAEYNNVKEAVASITDKDTDYYRIGNDCSIKTTPNIIYGNINYLNSTVYSSLSNQVYNNFYYDVLANNMPARNRALTAHTDNVLTMSLMGEKYILSDDDIELQGFNKKVELNGIKVYENENTLPLGFAVSKTINRVDFESLSDPEKQEALLKYAVVSDVGSGTVKLNARKIDLDYGEIFKRSDDIDSNGDSFTVDTDNSIKLGYRLPAEYHDKILFISFDVENLDKEKDVTVTVNNTANKQTEASWRYYNGNERFSYVLAEKNLSKLTIKLSDGRYRLSNFETYMMDYTDIANTANDLDKLYIDRNGTKGDIITGDINVKEDGYFIIQIPYDKGFEISIDGKNQEVVELDEAYIGCGIEKGQHHILIEYKAPLKATSIPISIAGAVLFIVMAFADMYRWKKNEKNILTKG